MSARPTYNNNIAITPPEEEAAEVIGLISPPSESADATTEPRKDSKTTLENAETLTSAPITPSMTAGILAPQTVTSAPAIYFKARKELAAMKKPREGSMGFRTTKGSNGTGRACGTIVRNGKTTAYYGKASRDEIRARLVAGMHHRSETAHHQYDESDNRESDLFAILRTRAYTPPPARVALLRDEPCKPKQEPLTSERTECFESVSSVVPAHTNLDDDEIKCIREFAAAMRKKGLGVCPGRQRMAVTKR